MKTILTKMSVWYPTAGITSVIAVFIPYEPSALDQSLSTTLQYQDIWTFYKGM